MEPKKKKYRKIRKKLVTGLSAFVVFCTTYALILPALTLSVNANTYCKKDEHIHTAECFTSSQPLCGMEEGAPVGHTHGPECYETQSDLICSEFEDGETHIHDENCYQDVEVLTCNHEESSELQLHTHDDSCYHSDTPLCGKEEHTHSRQCESDPEAIETEEEWTEEIPDELDSDPLKSVLQVANSQLGYKESTVNFKVEKAEKDGETKEIEKGYSRYGHRAEDRYGDWNKYFVGFVLYYSYGYDHYDADTYQWLSNSEGNLKLAKAGDIVFFDNDEKLNIGIIKNINRDLSMKIIAGDIDNKVKEIRKSKDDIYGVALLTDRTEEINSSEEGSEKPQMPENNEGVPEDNIEGDLADSFEDVKSQSPTIIQNSQKNEINYDNKVVISNDVPAQNVNPTLSGSANLTPETSKAPSQNQTIDLAETSNPANNTSSGTTEFTENKSDNNKPTNSDIADNYLSNISGSNKNSTNNQSLLKNDEYESPEKEAKEIGYIPEEGTISNNETEILDSDGNPYLKQTARDDKELIEVSVYYPQKAEIPENAKLKATYLETDDKGNYKFDVGFYDENSIEFEPKVPVQVKLILIGEIAAESEKDEIVHYKESDIIEVFQLEKQDNSRFLQSKFVLDSFSIIEIRSGVTVTTGHWLTVKKGSTATISGENPKDSTDHSWQNNTTKIVSITETDGSIATIRGIATTEESRGKITHTYYLNNSKKTETFHIQVVDNTVSLTLCNISQKTSPTAKASDGYSVGNILKTYTQQPGTTIKLPTAQELGVNNQENNRLPVTPIFVGWATCPNYTGTGNNKLVGENDLFLAGSTYTFTDEPVTLYAVWAFSGLTTKASFFLRLDGAIPPEPMSGNYNTGDEKDSTGQYTAAMNVDVGAIKHLVFHYNPNGIGVGTEDTDLLGAEPDAKAIVAAVNKANVTDSSGNKITLIYDETDGNMYRINDDGTQGKRMLASWYVIKNTIAAENQAAWHVDGVLREADQVHLIYDPNTPSSNAVTNMPVGKWLDKGTTVYVGHTLNSANLKALSNPVRLGYNFLGWSTSTNSRIPEYPIEDLEGFATNDNTFDIDSDTTLYAIWTRATNQLTVMKTDDQNNVLAGARFILEEKKDKDSQFEVIPGDLTTNINGKFTFHELENFSIYRLTEYYAPNGYENQNSFCFKVDIDTNNGSILKFYLCDEEGNPLTEEVRNKLDWIEDEYQTDNSKVNINLTIKDEIIERKAEFVKTDCNLSDPKTLEGALFTLEKYDDDQKKWKELTGILNTTGTESDGKFSLDSATLSYGKYRLTEVKNPEGFITMNPIEFVINDSIFQKDNNPLVDASAYQENAGVTVLSKDGADLLYTTLTRKVVNGDIKKIIYSYKFEVRNIEAPSLTLHKTDETGDKNLADAVFTLTKTKDEDSDSFSPITLATLKTDENGLATIPDGITLDKGTYELKETKAPKGYNLLTKPIEFYVHNDGSLTTTDSGNLSSDKSNYELKIQNTSGAALPETGGPGTNLLTFGGSITVLGSLLMYGYSKRLDIKKKGGNE